MSSCGSRNGLGAAAVDLVKAKHSRWRYWLQGAGNWYDWHDDAIIIYSSFKGPPIRTVRLSIGQQALCLTLRGHLVCIANFCFAVNGGAPWGPVSHKTVTSWPPYPLAAEHRMHRDWERLCSNPNVYVYCMPSVPANLCNDCHLGSVAAR